MIKPRGLDPRSGEDLGDHPLVVEGQPSQQVHVVQGEHILPGIAYGVRHIRRGAR